ncbi:MAG: hypothetical protein KME43_14955 [Myxacorys chilensis ATA2-1-KO14]|jgi:S1-C subfamily serine protease|nr:hypothetical protein [Myxacorys chilensis ATA2-1-KO14]
MDVILATRSVLSLAAGLLAGISIGVLSNHVSDYKPLNASSLQMKRSSDQNFITNVVHQVSSAVVRIDSTRIVKNPDADVESVLSQLFGLDLPKAPKQQLEREIG